MKKLFHYSQHGCRCGVQDAYEVWEHKEKTECLSLQVSVSNQNMLITDFDVIYTANGRHKRLRFCKLITARLERPYGSNDKGKMDRRHTLK